MSLIKNCLLIPQHLVQENDAVELMYAAGDNADTAAFRDAQELQIIANVVSQTECSDLCGCGNLLHITNYVCIAQTTIWEIWTFLKC